MTNAAKHLAARLQRRAAVYDRKGHVMNLSAIRIHRTVILATAAIVLAGFTAPGQAAEKAAAPMSDTAATSDGGGNRSRPDTKKYCVVESITGSHMPHKTCKTKSQWSDEGVDISQFAK